jgi:hypothetical protein
MPHLPEVVWYRTPNHGCWREHNNHYWVDVTPYMKFAPDPSFEDELAEPSVWIMARKSTAASYQSPTLLGGRDVRVSPSGDPRKVNLANRGLTGVAGLDGYYNAVARAKVYYHRPGTWDEHPTFWNPYWGAKLEPVATRIDALPESIALSDLRHKLEATIGNHAKTREYNWFILH